MNTATRLAAARREERFAAMRLVGATGRQVNVVAAVESAVSAAFGTLLGIAAFLAVRPALARISFSGARFFERTVTPTARRLRRHAHSRARGRHRVFALGAPPGEGLPARGEPESDAPAPPCLAGAAPSGRHPRVHRASPGGSESLDNVKTNPTTPLLYVGTFLIMAGLVLGGPWLTMQAARASARVSQGAASLLASRRLADNPKAAFRSVSGLVLAVFVGSLLASHRAGPQRRPDQPGRQRQLLDKRAASAVRCRARDRAPARRGSQDPR